MCVSGFSSVLDGEYAFDGEANGAPSWKKMGDDNYYIYWFVEWFRITDDATKRSAVSRQNALCSAPQSQGTSDPSYARDGGDCQADSWHYQYIDDVTNAWKDLYVEASVALGQCQSSGTPSPVTSSPVTASPISAQTPSPVTSAPITSNTPSPVTRSPTTTTDECVCDTDYAPLCCDATEEFSNECLAVCAGYEVTAHCVAGECTEMTTTSEVIDPTNSSGAEAAGLKAVLAVVGMMVMMGRME